MSYESKLDDAVRLIEEHNSVLKSLNAVLINHEKFIFGVKVSGGTSEASLKHFTHEDISRLLDNSFTEVRTGCPSPIALARSICEKFRNVDKDMAKVECESLSAKKIRGMSLEELCRRYDASDPSSLIFHKLKDLSNGKAFLVFDDNDNVLVEPSVKLLKELLDNFPPRDIYVLNDEALKVYKIGEKPPKTFNENPIFMGRPLRPDWTCDQTNRSWENIPLEIRQLIRLIARDTEAVNLKFAHDLMDMAIEVDAPKRLMLRYPHIAAKFKELKKTGTLPTLKIASNNGNSKFPTGKMVKIVD